MSRCHQRFWKKLRKLKLKLKLNLSAVLTEALLEKIRQNQRETWLRENKESVDAVNQWVDENGSFSDYQRSF